MAAILKAVADLNVSPFEAAMGRMEQRVSKFSSGQLAAMGRTIGAAFSVYAITSFAKSVGATADALQDLSDTTGVGVENLQAIQVLFQQNGKSAEDAAGVFARLKKSMDDATDNEKIAQSFRKLGISFEDVARLSPDKVLERIAQAMAANAGDMEMSAAAGDLLGRNYASLQGAMNALASQGLDPLREGLKATNEIMGAESVAAAARAQEAYEKLGRSLKTKAGNALISFVGGLQAAWIAVKTGGDWSAAADALFGPTDTANDPLANKAANDRRKASAAAMGNAADKRKLAADAWLAEASGKIKVGDVRAADSLGGIGGYIGGQSNPAQAIAERQLEIAKLQLEYQKRMGDASEKTADNTAQMVNALEE